MNFPQLYEIIFFGSWPDVNLNRNVSELQMFTNYYNLIDMEEVLKKLRSKYGIHHDREKNLSEATKSRTLGNDLYKNKAYEEALYNYDNSILMAPRDSVEFGLALANRSAVYFDMEKYKECLDDINLVSKSEYPKKLRYKIFLRQSKCYLKLNLNFNVAKTLRRAQECVDELELSEVQRKAINNNIMILKNQLKQHYLMSNVPNDKPVDNIQSELSLKEGENVPNDKPEDNIRPELSLKDGENVSNDKPEDNIRPELSLKDEENVSNDVPDEYIVFIFPQDDEKFVPYDYIPSELSFKDGENRKFLNASKNIHFQCTMCTSYLYCSEDCRQKAWDRGHRWDCYGKRRGIILSDMQHACLHVLFNATRDGFQTKVNEKSVYGNRENNYPFVHKLLTNKNKIEDTKLKLFIKASVWLVLYLKHFTDYFDWLYVQTNRPEGSKDDLLKLIGGLFVTYFLQLGCNATIISQTYVQLSEYSFPMFKCSSVGLGLYVSSALLNHSCLPNCVDSFHGTKRVIKASKDIKKGTEVVISYLYSDYDFRDEENDLSNKIELERYMFNCTCRKCSDPDYENIKMAYLCPRCSGKALMLDNITANCIECNFKFNAVGYTLIERKIVELFQSDPDHTGLQRLYKLIKKIYNKNSNIFLAYYLHCMQYYDRIDDMKNLVDNTRLLMEIYKNICKDDDTNMDYTLNYIVFTYVVAKYCKSLITYQNATPYKKYLKETKEMVKKCTDMLEYFTCPYYIKKFITDMTEYLKLNDSYLGEYGEPPGEHYE